MGRILYKYRDYKSLYRDDYFTLREVHFSSPRQMNDPFDIHPYVKHLSDEDKQQLIKTCGIGKFFSSDEIGKGIRNLSGADLYYSVQEVLSHVYILSLSKTYKSIQMWAHYADQHRGICVGFDISMDKACFSSPCDVIYKEERAQINLLELYDLNPTSIKAQIRKAITTKQEQWGYEEEVRCLHEFSEQERAEQRTNKVFNKAAIKEIVFGWLTPQEDIRRIMNLCKENKLDVDFYQMVMVNTPSFMLERERLDYLKI